MKESYIEGLASHDGPESCGYTRKGISEALTGGHVGRVLSREIKQIREPTLLSEAEGNRVWPVMARVRPSLRGRRPLAYVANLMRENRENHSPTHRRWQYGLHREGQGRTAMIHGEWWSDRHVVPTKSLNKAEQGKPPRRKWRREGVWPRGTWGAKHTPDTEPDRGT